ncbi:MAG: hypothetical protein ACOC6R_00625 [Chloroflexota bacterium]
MFCRNCGRELIGAPEFCMNCGAKPMAGTSFCPDCGAQTTPLTKVCTNCGAQVSKTMKGETWKPTAAGILCIIAGVIGLITGIVVAVAGGIGGAFIGMAWLSAVGAPLITLGIVAIVGGIYALRRRLWGLALAGSICALVGPWALLGILAIVFVSLGKDEFE